MTKQLFGSPSLEDEQMRAEFRRVWAEIKARGKEYAEFSSDPRAEQKAAHNAMWAKERRG